jgi:hypothetical protein
MRNFSRLIALLLVFFSAHSLADVLLLEPQKDNTLFEDAQGRFSNGAGQYLFMGRTGGDNGIDRLLRRALLSFDLSAIPQGSEINSVELQLTIDKVPLDATGGISTVHRLLGDWGEGSSNAPGPEGQGTGAASGDATWIHTFFATNTWNAAGGDFIASASQSANFSSSPQTLNFLSSTQLVADVAAWVNNPTSNYGWIVLGDEPANQNARRLLSREHADSLTRPRLMVEYTPVATAPVPATGFAGLLLLITMMMFVLKFIARVDYER